MPDGVAGSDQPDIGDVSGRRRQSLVALATIACCGVGLVSLAGAFVRYFSSPWTLTLKQSGERIELYVAVFAGALLVAASALAFFRLRNTMRAAVQTHVSACPGCALVDLFALLLCIWLGYGFVTEASPALGLSVLVAAAGLSAALGVHLAATVDDRYGLLVAAAHGRRWHPAHRAHCGSTRRRAALFRVEWRADAMNRWPSDDFTQRWTLTVAPTRSRAARHCALRNRGDRRQTGRNRGIGR
ncbi:NAD(P)(+) transhydrogenase (Re/Si-specific) subunit beta [Paraburkholderia rhizosphaerae]|uniref:NAD(P) transhydrogenase subunit beta n=1 Tax=Paraburkholderia rhizosphaerae TaxID=480658 RepID=A0A4R8LJT7_9BURK|nr:NAD(P)(+) transhydrogenase (Re/Si-specific) subunit beta [Paraburkholderia rhizosphaerae]TDY42534.1 NAD(P) transhydrogenase subunit beta [Paraburkholderia rhizosphaerae]